MVFVYVVKNATSVKKPKTAIKKCIKQWICNLRVLRKERCDYVAKNYFTQYKKISIQRSCSEYEKISPRCNSENKFFIL